MINPAWFWVILGGVVEAIYTTFMGLADGLNDLMYTMLGLGFSIVGTLLLNEGLKRDLPVGPSYAVWVGVGVGGAAIADILVFANGLSVLGYLFLALVLGGVVGINVKGQNNVLSRWGMVADPEGASAMPPPNPLDAVSLGGFL